MHTTKPKVVAQVGNQCVSCSACIHACPVGAITLMQGIVAEVDPWICVGCKRCVKACPAGVITMQASPEPEPIDLEQPGQTACASATKQPKPKPSKWLNWLWLASISYFVLGFYNILFAWLGFICIATPILQAMLKSNKSFCSSGCPRSKVLELLGKNLRLSKGRNPPEWLSSKWFRNLFMYLFFGTVFSLFCTTYISYQQQPIRQAIIGLWQQYAPHTVANLYDVPFFLAMFALASYSAMSSSMLLGLITLLLYKPKTWCVYCPMGTLTQNICKDNLAEAQKKLAKSQRSR
jgi:ferredoxin